VTAHLTALHSAIKMLCGKVAVVQERMEGVAAAGGRRMGGNVHKGVVGVAGHARSQAAWPATWLGAHRGLLHPCFLLKNPMRRQPTHPPRQPHQPGECPEYPHELVRQVNSLVSSLPALDNPAFKK
jgi:hypothetical protein